MHDNRAMHERAYRPPSHTQTVTAAMSQPLSGPGRAFQVAEALSWALMILGLATASLVLINSYLLAG
jgi:hypothetical protein